MISVTKLNDKDIVINCELIECIESTPDTMITMTTGKRIMVKESTDEIIELVIKYKQRAVNKIL